MDVDAMYHYLTGRLEPHFEWALKPQDKKQKYINKLLKQRGLYGMSNDEAQRSARVRQRIQVKLLRKEREKMREEYAKLGL